MLLNKIKYFKRSNIKIIQIIIAIICIVFTCKNNNIFAADKVAGISAFPNSYQIYLRQLQKLHSNWTFTAMYTGIDWKTAVKNEGPTVDLKRSAIQVSFADVWKWKDSNGNYNVIEPGWVTASEAGIGYAMDPRRYINEMQIFQFETLNYDSTTQNQNGVEKIFYGTLMYQKNITYTDTSGKTQTINKTYSKVVMEAAAQYGVSPYHLASRIRQETGCDIQNNVSIKGNVSGYVGLYNYYNIGATGGDNPAISGLAYARKKGWTTPELAIKGGAEFIAEKYINAGQYTTYLQKFNVNDDGKYALYTHQYMQNILAPSSESMSMFNAYSKLGLLSVPFNFVIPVYNNMPESPVDIYVQNPNEYVTDSTKVYCTDNLNVRSGPGTNNSIILTAPKGTVMTRIARGVQAGERWDKVRLSSGLEGYVFQSYIKEQSYTKVTGVSLNKDSADVVLGDTLKLTASISPSNATYKDVYWLSSDSSIAAVSDDGLVTPKKAGVVVITVTTDDQVKTATCVVNIVEKKDPSITLDKDTYNIIKDKDTSFTVTISNSDIKEYDLVIENEDIAKVENGKIVGLAEGSTKIKVNIKGTDIKDEATIKVFELSEGDINIDPSINVNGDIISKINPDTKVQDIKDKIETTYDISVKNSSGTILEDSSLVGTGTKIQLLNEDNIVMFEYNIIIYGDVSGDGKITSKDYMMIKNHIMGTSTISGITAKSADTYNDGKITSKDYMMIKNHIMGTSKIVQR